MPTTTSTLAQLQRALAIAEHIQQLEEELRAVMSWETGNGRASAPATTEQPAKRKPGRPPKSVSLAEAPDAQPAKRGPGRPSKSASPMASPASQPPKSG